jgi:hypothetical protein
LSPYQSLLLLLLLLLSQHCHKLHSLIHSSKGVPVIRLLRADHILQQSRLPSSTNPPWQVLP